MRSERYLLGVTSLYQGEVLGEALFSGLLAASPVPYRQEQFATMLQLETEAKLRLRPFLVRLGLSVVEDESARRAGCEEAARLAALSWPAFLEQFAASITHYVRLYEEIAALAPAEDAATVGFMVAHEQALLAYAEAERAGRSADAQAALSAQLLNPLGRSTVRDAARAPAGR